MRLAAAVLAASLAAAVPAGAAEKPTQQQQLAVELARLSTPEANWDQIVSQFKAQMRAAVEQGMRSSGQEVPERIVKIVQEEMDASMEDVFFTYAEVIDLQAGLLVKHYTEGELQQLVSFYRSPVGQKSIQVMPAVMQDAMAAGQQKAQERLPAKLQGLQKRLEAELAAMKAEAEAAEAAPKAKPAAKPAAAKKPAAP